MSYRHCFICGEGADRPTAEDDLLGPGVRCRNCGHTFPQLRSVEEWVADLDERLRRIEATLPPDAD